MVLGAINHDFRSDLVLIQGNLTAHRYINEVLQPVLIPLLQRHRNNGQLTFQQDNARAHSARLTQNYLMNQRIDVLEWPSVSPDMNCIEHMWDKLGRRLRRRPQQPQNVRDLWLALHQEWHNIPMATVRRLVRSMPQRLQAVIANNGGHTRY